MLLLPSFPRQGRPHHSVCQDFSLRQASLWRKEAASWGDLWVTSDDPSRYTCHSQQLHVSLFDGMSTYQASALFSICFRTSNLYPILLCTPAFIEDFTPSCAQELKKWTSSSRTGGLSRDLSWRALLATYSRSGWKLLPWWFLLSHYCSFYTTI
jgi:hypothetical protein